MFHVSEYTGPERIIDRLQRYRPFKDTDLSKNCHFNYLKQYFDTVEVKTIVFESEYFDKDYLEDYSRYYSRCFQSYDKKCVRVHFFSHKFNKKKFVAIITNPTQKEKDIADLQKNYVGFVVFRPIPHTIFGRTCLKTFPDQEKDSKKHPKPEKNRQIPIVREYKVHLFGIELSLNSLAYQEQDNAVSACATSALWSAFQSTGISFHHPIHSPYEITLSAKELISGSISANSDDKRGLDSKQMAYAVKAVGLEPLLLNPVDKDYLKAQVCAYLRGKIPIVMGLKLYGKKPESSTGNPQYDEKNIIGYHAITLTGYNLNNKLSNHCYTTPETNDNDYPQLYLRSSKIDKFYVHDDQVGPFARIKFHDELAYYYLKTFFTEIGHRKNDFDSIDAAPTVLLLPVVHKIRIDFHEIFSIVKIFNNNLTNPFDAIESEDYKDSIIVWDIHLSNVCDLKQYFSTCRDISPDNKKTLLTKSFPRHVWVVDAYQGKRTGMDEEKLFSFYFDATDIYNGNLFLCALHYDGLSYEIVHAMVETILLENVPIENKDSIKQILSSYSKPNKNNPIFK
jgi:hypothetical protein